MISQKTGTAGISLLLFLMFYTGSAKGEAVQRTTIKVDNLTCGYCLSQINAKLQTMDGYLSMVASLERGIVTIDHRLTLSGKGILEAVSSIGYTATVVSESEIDEKEVLSIFADQGSHYRCASGTYGKTVADPAQVSPGSADETSSQGNNLGSGCCSLNMRPVRSATCGASGSAWQELKRRFFN